MKQVAAAIARQADRVLVTRRAPGQHLAGFWEFPGGKLEEGETAHSTVLMGDFKQAILGMGEHLTTILKERFADTGQPAFVAHIRADVGFARPESFVKLIGVKP